MIKHTVLLLATALVACDGTSVLPTEPDRVEASTDFEAASGPWGDPLYAEVRSLVSHPSVLELAPGERDLLSPDDCLLLAAMDLMERSFQEGVLP